MIQQTKDWNLKKSKKSLYSGAILIQWSNKPRIETILHHSSLHRFIYSYPMIQQTKDWNKNMVFLMLMLIIILIQWSNKPRIETHQFISLNSLIDLFLSNDPTNQGLKLIQGGKMKTVNFQFLSNDPTNQGLKLNCVIYSLSLYLNSYPMIQQTKDWNWTNITS